MMPPIAVLAGGLATRMRPLTETVPKALLEVAGEPFIARQLKLFKRHGLEEAVLCLGFLGEQVRDFAGDGAAFGMKVRYSFDGPTLLGTGGALKKAADLLGDAFWVIYGDSYLDVDYRAVWDHFRAQPLPALMTVCRNEDRWDASNVLFEDGRIRVYDKKDRTPAMKHIDYGLLLFRREVLDRIPAGEKTDLSAVLGGLVRDGLLAGYEMKERFYEIGSPQGLKETDEYIRKSRP